MKKSNVKKTKRTSFLHVGFFAIVTNLFLSTLIPLSDTGIVCMPNWSVNGSINQMNPDGKQLRRFTNILNTTVHLLVH